MSPVPVSTGHLEKAEAIYNGARGNLVGIRTRLGNTPQHGVLFGMTGAGKSVIVADLLAQTGHRFGLRLIVEECARRFMSGHLLGVLERPSFSS